MKMKGYIKNYLIISIIFICSFSSQDKTLLPILKSNIDTIDYKIDDNEKNWWRIVPEYRPDRMIVYCYGERKVKFISDIDSISFKINVGDTVQFYVLHSKKDSALTEIVGVQKLVNFSENYIKTNRGKVTVEIPEVQELVYIMVAISKVGRIDDNLVDMNTEYYQEVKNHFTRFDNHPIMDTINNHITKVYDNESIFFCYSLKMNACGYLFRDNKIQDDSIIYKMGWDADIDPIRQNKELIEDFAKKSGFREFYAKHEPYYKTLIKEYNKYSPLSKMKNWLEDKFNKEYDHYRVTFSPLTGGVHSTRRFMDNGFSQTVMFVSSVSYNNQYNDNINEMKNSRMVFTEIDHNFVNPVSKKNQSTINKSLSNREKWAKGPFTEAYQTPYKIFNEYMTWSIFSIYCYENFPEEDVEVYIPLLENQMTHGRGFINFEKFNRELIEYYRKENPIEIESLFEHMIHWCEKQNNA